MKKSVKLFLSTLMVAIVTFLIFPSEKNIEKHNSFIKIKSSSSPNVNVELKKERNEYFFRMLRDPKTGKVPKNIRQKELEFAKQLNLKNKNLNKVSSIQTLAWQEAGPIDVGGRTRAIAVDITNSNTIIAGGVSGGIWKSTDKGATWQMKSTTSQILSVTSIAQDTRTGQTNTWYYSSGEFRGSAEDQGKTHLFSGGGIYKSTDNGESWSLLPNAKDTNPIQFNTPYDFVSKIIVNPASGSVFIASHAFGILRSVNGGSSFELVLGGVNEHIYADIDVAPNGTLLAVISSPFSGTTASNTPGVYKSTNDGTSWTNITPNTFPPEHFRSVINAANNNTVYVLTTTGNLIDNKYEDIRFHKINISTGSSEDRSANMPVFSFPAAGSGEEEWLKTQGSYNMVLAVKPDNENFVVIGGTSLFRSTNGFSTKPNNAKLDWIGGYHPQDFRYPNFHPDVHSFAFDPSNPNAMWWGHDGGLSYTSNITNTNYSTYFPWENKNNGYNVTQFYTIAIPNIPNDNRIMGGTQDNGTPYFQYNGSTTLSEDLSSGDGSYGYWGSSYCYASSQEGRIIRVSYNNSGIPSQSNGWSDITPTDASNQLFITPFVVDPADENIMLYPAGNILWRNNQLNSIPLYSNGTTTGWSQLTNVSLPSNYIISALAISETNPTHRLYYAAADVSQSPTVPKIYRLDNANTATSGAIDISISGLDGASYIHNIAINPDNANELIVIISNYNVVGIYHSTDAGQSFTAVEGNLIGDQNNPGPSVRGAAILPTSNGTLYLVATSTGVYSTTQLNAGSTTWIQEGQNTLGNIVVNYLAARKSDGKIVAGTHGRGAFVAQVSAGGTAVADVNVGSLTLQSRPGQTGSTSFVLSNSGEATLNYNIEVNGSFGGALPKSTKNNSLLQKNELSFKKHKEMREKLKSFKIDKNIPINKTNTAQGEDYLYLDDGGTTPDTFIGFGDNGTGGSNKFTWINEFNLSGLNFEMDSFEFFMRTEGLFTNSTYLEILDENLNTLDFGTLDLPLSADGIWQGITLSSPISFNDGSTFYILISSDNNIWYPAGADYNAAVPNKSFYSGGTNWVNLNTISGFENAAFLIRAKGTISSGGGNSNIVTVNPSSGTLAPGASQTVTLTLNAQNLGEGTYTGQVNITSNGGNITIPIDYLVSVEQISSLPSKFSLSQNYPNPFNPTTVIKFSLPKISKVSLKIYDVLGKEIATLVNENKSAGTYRVSFDAVNLSSGIYVYRLETQGFSQSRKMLLLK